MSEDLRSDLERARLSTAVPVADFQLLSPHRYADILGEILERFTTLGKDRRKYYWLWEHFREPVSSLTTDQPWVLLTELLNPHERVWFLAEDWGRKKKHEPFWLYEGSVAAIAGIIAESFSFEYYLVSKKYDWLLMENHHNILIGSGEPIAAAIAAYRERHKEGAGTAFY